MKLINKFTKKFVIFPDFLVYTGHLHTTQLKTNKPPNKMQTNKAIIRDLKHKIHTIRGVQTIIDSDLSTLYNVPTRVLNQAVKRNINRFPEDFMFQLNNSEFRILKSQIVTSSWGGKRKLPFAFTEHGVAMLSGVLKSEKAVEVNIQIIRAFISMRNFISKNAEIFLRLNIIERKQLEQDNKFEIIFDKLQNKIPDKGIFFDGQIFDAYNFVSDIIRTANKSIITKKQEKKQHKEKIENQTKKIKELVYSDLKYERLEKLKTVLEELKTTVFQDEIFKEYGKDINKRINEINDLIKEKEHIENIIKLQKEERELTKRLQNIEYELKQKEQTEYERKEEIREKLDLKQKVFLKEELSKDEIQILKEEEYIQSNEYDINKNKVITVLVQKVLNHSSSHTFLAWSTKKYLETNHAELTKIEEHETKDADITFKYKNKYYALEIETGTLLKKSRQLAEKIQYLNTKYKDRWMIITTNEKLVPKYNKYGLASQRTDLEKNLKKLLKISTQ